MHDICTYIPPYYVHTYVCVGIQQCTRRMRDEQQLRAFFRIIVVETSTYYIQYSDTEDGAGELLTECGLS